MSSSDEVELLRDAVACVRAGLGAEDLRVAHCGCDHLRACALGCFCVQPRVDARPLRRVGSRRMIAAVAVEAQLCLPALRAGDLGRAEQESAQSNTDASSSSSQSETSRFDGLIESLKGSKISNSKLREGM